MLWRPTFLRQGDSVTRSSPHLSFCWIRPWLGLSRKHHAFQSQSKFSPAFLSVAEFAPKQKSNSTAQLVASRSVSVLVDIVLQDRAAYPQKAWKRTNRGKVISQSHKAPEIKPERRSTALDANSVPLMRGSDCTCKEVICKTFNVQTERERERKRELLLWTVQLQRLPFTKFTYCAQNRWCRQNSLWLTKDKDPPGLEKNSQRTAKGLSLLL